MLIKRLVFCLSFLLPIALMSYQTISGGSVSLRWDHNTPLPEGYRVFQREGTQSYNYSSPVWEGPEDTTVGSTIALEKAKEDYCFVVRAYDGDLESADSEEVCVTTAAVKPSSPTGVEIDDQF